VAQDSFAARRFCAQPDTVRRHRLSVVHRRASRPLGELEDRFFATVVLGSGLLFLAMLFASTAVLGGLVIAYSAEPKELIDSATFTFARAVTFEILNVYAIKMAAVFMISTSTLAIRTGFISRWIAVVGYGLALLLLLVNRYVEWIIVVFPLWVLLVSLHILIDNRGTALRTAMTSPGHGAR
jgi:hypothetical protein